MPLPVEKSCLYPFPASSEQAEGDQLGLTKPRKDENLYSDGISVKQKKKGMAKNYSENWLKYNEQDFVNGYKDLEKIELTLWFQIWGKRGILVKYRKEAGLEYGSLC